MSSYSDEAKNLNNSKLTNFLVSSDRRGPEASTPSSIACYKKRIIAHTMQMKNSSTKQWSVWSLWYMLETSGSTTQLGIVIIFKKTHVVKYSQLSFIFPRVQSSLECVTAQTSVTVHLIVCDSDPILIKTDGVSVSCKNTLQMLYSGLCSVLIPY